MTTPIIWVVAVAGTVTVSCWASELPTESYLRTKASLPIVGEATFSDGDSSSAARCMTAGCVEAAWLPDTRRKLNIGQCTIAPGTARPNIYD